MGVFIFVVFMVYKKRKNKGEKQHAEVRSGKRGKEAVHSVEISGANLAAILSASDALNTDGLYVDKGDNAPDEIDILKQESRAAEALYEKVSTNDVITAFGEDDDEIRQRMEKMEVEQQRQCTIMIYV